MYKLSIEVSTLAGLSELTRKLNSDSATSVELASTTVKKKVTKKKVTKKAPVAEAPTVEADTSAAIVPEQSQTIAAPAAQEVNGFANVFQSPTASAPIAAPVAPTKEELLAEVQGFFAAAAGLTQEQQSEVIQDTYTFLGWDGSKKLSECTAEELNRAIPKFKGSLHAKGVMV